MPQSAESWFKQLGWKAQDFQKECWEAYAAGKSGLLNAPTGSGKTYALMLAAMMEANPDEAAGLKLLWLSPIRALTKELELAAQRAISGLQLNWTVGIRTGDTSEKEKRAQAQKLPDLLITTPESLHLMLARKEYAKQLKLLRCVVVDEWHELLGTKRGVLVELGLSRLKGLLPELKVWGISATIGNLPEAKQVLHGYAYSPEKVVTVRAQLKKEVEIITLFPDEIEKFPWAGHLGIRMLDKVLPLLDQSKSTLIFTNTRSFAEVWYQKLLEAAPHLAGQIAMHHGSVSKELRYWVEDALHQGLLKVVVCTSSLDLGVDFRPVDTVIQIGSPKGVSRFLQRAGRSGHQPGKPSRIYFVPTHSLEILEGAALREAASEMLLEDRIPYLRSFDVLAQYLMTLAVSDGFYPKQIFREVSETFCFQEITWDEFEAVLRFLVKGGDTLKAYDEFHRLEVFPDGLHKVTSRKIAMQHRLSIGTIVSDQSLMVKYMSGKKIGAVEEWFVAQLKPGTVFWLAGKNLELIQIKGMDVLVKPSSKTKGLVPSWMGGRMPLSSNLSFMLRKKMTEWDSSEEEELKLLAPLVAKQRELSHAPTAHEFLIEKLETEEGFHLFAFPFEGRFVNQGLASLLAWRLSLIQPFTFSIAINDYGFELLSDQEIPIEMGLDSDIFTTEHLLDDLQKSLNETEMARRKFRDIARISGLVFQGYPGKPVKQKHLQSNSQLFFDVFEQYEPGHFLLKQAYEEVLDFELEQVRLRRALERIAHQEIILRYPEKPTPFGFPIMVDRLNREKFSTESMEDRIKKMLAQFGE
ncbi:MAG: ligase-associated DNA damage response DEXH box helicase [Bacteroidetes bacterium]|nr:MAG: ligase-associated DNA damage response DEXH box helicase [Bacteroidota bacterium]